MKVKETVKNFFRLTTKQIAGMAVLSALAVVLALVLHVSIFPQVAFLEYDMADIPIFLGTFMYGTFAGIIMTVVVSVIQGVTVSAGSGFIGILMHIFATGIYVIVAGLIYEKHRTFKGALVAMGSGIVAWIVGMILWNIILTPIFMGAPRAVVIDLLGYIVAFNLIKVGANTVATFLFYKRLSKLFDYIFRTGKYPSKKKVREESVSSDDNAKLSEPTTDVSEQAPTTEPAEEIPATKNSVVENAKEDISENEVPEKERADDDNDA